MNQNPSHSQMPEFDTHKDAFLVVVLLGTIGSVPFTVRSCSNDVDRQHAASLKYQLQFSASSNEGAR